MRNIKAAFSCAVLEKIKALPEGSMMAQKTRTAPWNTMRAFPRTLFLALACLSLAGCAAVFPSAPPSTYDLLAPKDLPQSHASRAIVVVAEPVAIQALDSERIVARTASGQITYVPDAQWADKLTALLQARIVQSLENSGRLVSVGRPGERLAAQTVLMTDIRSFELNDGGSSTYAQIEIAAKLVRDNSGQILAARVFSARVSVSGVSGLEANTGLNKALGDVLTQIVEWMGSR